MVPFQILTDMGTIVATAPSASELRKIMPDKIAGYGLVIIDDNGQRISKSELEERCDKEANS